MMKFVNDDSVKKEPTLRIVADYRDGDLAQQVSRQQGFPLDALVDGSTAEVNFVICVQDIPGVVYPESVQAPCADCGTPIVHKIYAPSAEKVCVSCAIQRLQGIS